MTKQILIYFSHPMEKGRSLEETKVRGIIFEQKVGKGFKVWHPEDAQVGWDKQKQVDLDAEYACDILVVDMFNVGIKTENGIMLGEGTNAELGFMFGCNKCRNKKVPIVVIMPKRRHYHCFRKPGSWSEYGVTKIVYSLDDAANYVRNWKSKK